MNRNSPTLRIIAFVAIFTLGIALRILLFAGLQGSDDLQYMDSAYQFLTGGFAAVPDDLTKTRLLLYLPVAFCFAVFDVSEVSAILYPFCCSIGLLVLVHQLGTLLFNSRAARSRFGGWPTCVFAANRLDLSRRRRGR